MRNRYPGLCTVCKANVAPGDGLLSKEEGRWSVAHAKACSPDTRQREDVHRIVVKAFSILDSPSSENAHIVSALLALSKLVGENVLNGERCYEKIMASLSLRKMHRLDVEIMLDTYWSPPVSR